MVDIPSFLPKFVGRYRTFKNFLSIDVGQYKASATTMAGNLPLIICMRIGAVMALAGASEADAMGPVYINLGALFLTGALYLAGLIAIPFGIGLSKEQTAKRAWSLLLAVYIIAPTAYFYAENKHYENHWKKIEEEKIGADRVANISAFSQFCKDRKRVVHSKAEGGSNVSMFVRFTIYFSGDKATFNADKIADALQRKGTEWVKPALCSHTGLQYLEGDYGAKMNAQKGIFITEFRRYWLCERHKPEIQSEIHSRYELVLGEANNRVSAPGRQILADQMYSSSVRLVDRSTKAVLAEDTMYFLGTETGMGGCPSGLTQLSELTAEVFSAQ